VLDGVAFGQPALSLAAQIQRRAERAGLSVPVSGEGPASPDDGVPVDNPAIGSASAGGAPAAGDASAEIGAELMRLVARARARGVDPELALREASRAYAGEVREAEQSRSE
jgi:XTP/dITP diphosphohydrolase